jgi:hypothetical protein
MTTAQLVQLVRKHGGDIRLHPCTGGLQVRGLKARLRDRILRECQTQSFRLRAFLAEEHAAQYWEACGKDPEWWKTYDSFTSSSAWFACTCSAYSFPHIHTDTGPTANYVAERDVFDELKGMLPKNGK